ncbi:hypothetical protein HKX48_003219 [Thoreauomyces humboldtii]|nr:hypothetical protein HKX48_003219 [Thoreauomyces humboldtii]
MLIQPVLAAAAAVVSPSLQGPTVSTAAGTYSGKTCPLAPSYASYLGIPFANAPVSNLRFAAPVAYDGPFKTNVTTMPPACVQGPFAGVPPPTDQSEDCLFLNVYSPISKPSAPLPVRFFIYGGGFESGDVSSHYYDGCHAAPPTNSIVVTANYRVGPLGFLAHPVFKAADGSLGNYGIQDQQLALKWIKANIASFGGDPEHVGIWGESAGGSSVFAHMVAPSSAGLFSSAIAESGDITGFAPADWAAEVAKDFASSLGCPATGDVASCLRSASPAAILNATDTAPNPGQPDYKISDVLASNRPTYALVQDGVFFPSAPIEAFTSGSFNKVPLLAGTNAQEANFFMPNITFTASDYQKYIADVLPANLTANVTALYPLSAYQSPNQAISAIMTDRWFACPTRKALAAVASQNVPAYSYFFNVTLSCDFVPGVSAQALGASHYTEIPFVFDYVKYLIGPCSLSQPQQNLAAAMGLAWTDMAATGKPYNASGATWPTYPAYESLTEAGAVAIATGGMADYWAERCAVFDAIDYPLSWTQTNWTTTATSTTSTSGPGASQGTTPSQSSGAAALIHAPSVLVGLAALVAIL